MAERILPAPDAFATCPRGGKILEYYAGVFEAVYVLLHPFIRPLSIGKEEFKPGTYPTRGSIVKNCTAVSWDEVATKAGLPSIAGVDIGFRTRIRGLRAEFSNQEYADKSNRSLSLRTSYLPQKGPSRISFMTEYLRTFKTLATNGFGSGMNSAPKGSCTG